MDNIDYPIGAKVSVATGCMSAASEECNECDRDTTSCYDSRLQNSASVVELEESTSFSVNINPQTKTPWV